MPIKARFAFSQRTVKATLRGEWKTEDYMTKNVAAFIRLNGKTVSGFLVDYTKDYIPEYVFHPVGINAQMAREWAKRKD